MRRWCSFCSSASPRFAWCLSQFVSNILWQTDTKSSGFMLFSLFYFSAFGWEVSTIVERQFFSFQLQFNSILIKSTFKVSEREIHTVRSILNITAQRGFKQSVKNPSVTQMNSTEHWDRLDAILILIGKFSILIHVVPKSNSRWQPNYTRNHWVFLFILKSHA